MSHKDRLAQLLRGRLRDADEGGRRKVGESEDKALTCADCGREFTFGAGEQDFFRGKGLQPPKRCKECRQGRKEQGGGGRSGRRGGGNR